MKAAIPALALLLLAGACGQKSAGDQTADNLHAAADQSDPAAAKVLDNAADTAADQGAGDANATAQAALAEAGNAQATTTGAGETPTSTSQAAPHKPGQKVPGPKIGGSGQ